MKRISSAAIVILFLCAATNGVAPLVEYSFDDGLTDTGPDTFSVFQNAKGHVRLSSEIRYSGYRSIELRDVAEDGDFPELQGYFPERSSGELYFHFAMLVANPGEPLNVALAGRSHFSLTEHGIAFWLKTIDGTLHHVSDSIPKKLFKLEPFTWYVVDVRLDVAGGTYDLTIRRERTPAPLLTLTDQPNAVNAPGSSVDKFSFVGSVFEDDSDVTFYVDDVVLGTDEKVILGAFVAPGRRKLFVDRWRETRMLMMKNPGCPPVLSKADLGISEGAGEDTGAPSNLLNEACAMEPLAGAKRFRELSAQHPGAPVFAIGELISLVRSGDDEAALRRWNELEAQLQHDVRYGMIAAMMGLENDRQDDETRYFVMLWNKEFTRAARLAEKNGWLERAGDALFLSGSPGLARGFYERAYENEPGAYWPSVKLSDVFHLLGDSASEKVFRERVYGVLKH